MPLRILEQLFIGLVGIITAFNPVLFRFWSICSLNRLGCFDDVLKGMSVNLIYNI
jgi:hypothetical protein